MFIPVGSYMPDMPDYNNPGSSFVKNVVPRTPKSFGPLASLKAYTTTAFAARAQGAFPCIDNAGNPFLFVGSAAKLEKLGSGELAPTDVSVTGGYTCGASERWNFCQYGQRIIATDYADDIQLFTLGTSTDFADLANGGVKTLTVTAGSGYTDGTDYALTATGGNGSDFAGLVDVVSGALTNARVTTPGNGYTSTPTIAVPTDAGSGSGGAITVSAIADIAPKARYVATVKDFVVAFNTNDSTDGAQPQRVWWSGIGDPTEWPTPGSNDAVSEQSGFSDQVNNFGWGTGIVGNLGAADAALFFERGIIRMMYVGSPNVFAFLPAEGVRGTRAPGSIVHNGALAYYLGEDGFYVFDGSTSEPIGSNKVDKTFFADLDNSYFDRVTGTVDPINKLIIWSYPGAGNSSGTPNKLLIYNWVLGEWSYGEVSCDMIFRSVSFGSYTLDSLDDTFTDLDTIPASLDSRAWTGGSILLSAIDTDHNLSNFTGDNLEAVVDTTEQSSGVRATIHEARPIVDGGIPTVSIGTRNRQIDNVTYGSAVALNNAGVCPVRSNGRYVRARITVPAATRFTHIQGVELTGSGGGSR